MKLVRIAVSAAEVSQKTGLCFVVILCDLLCYIFCANDKNPINRTQTYIDIVQPRWPLADPIQAFG